MPVMLKMEYGKWEMYVRSAWMDGWNGARDRDREQEAESKPKALHTSRRLEISTLL